MAKGGALLEFALALRQISTALLGWIFGYPLTFIVPRDPRLTLVIGRRGVAFGDNSKYFFAYASDAASKNELSIYLSNDTTLLAKIRAAGGLACFHPSFRSMWLALRCQRMVVDVAEWFDFGVYQLSRGAQLVQLWHGTPLKHIELDVFRKRLQELPFFAEKTLITQKCMLGRYPVYDAVIATSDHVIDRTLSTCFHAKRFLSTGYPRNDILFALPPTNSIATRLISLNTDTAVKNRLISARRQGWTTALYAPTFRRDLHSPFDFALNLSRLDQFATQHKLLILIKLHPLLHERDQLDEYQNLIECAPLSDVYPLLVYFDSLITDYSSIYFDFLLLDRPIIFFAYDLDSYVLNDRSMYFPYESVTPGAICKTQIELEGALTTVCDNEDEYGRQRKLLCKRIHVHARAGAVARLLDQLD